MEYPCLWPEFIDEIHTEGSKHYFKTDHCHSKVLSAQTSYKSCYSAKRHSVRNKSYSKHLLNRYTPTGSTYPDYNNWNREHPSDSCPFQCSPDFDFRQIPLKKIRCKNIAYEGSPKSLNKVYQERVAQVSPKHLRKKPTNIVTESSTEYFRTYDSHDVNAHAYNCEPASWNQQECKQIIPEVINDPGKDYTRMESTVVNHSNPCNSSSNYITGKAIVNKENGAYPNRVSNADEILKEIKEGELFNQSTSVGSDVLNSTINSAILSNTLEDAFTELKETGSTVPLYTDDETELAVINLQTENFLDWEISESLQLSDILNLTGLEESSQNLITETSEELLCYQKVLEMPGKVKTINEIDIEEIDEKKSLSNLYENSNEIVNLSENIIDESSQIINQPLQAYPGATEHTELSKSSFGTMLLENNQLLSGLLSQILLDKTNTQTGGFVNHSELGSEIAKPTDNCVIKKDSVTVSDKCITDRKLSPMWGTAHSPEQLELYKNDSSKHQKVSLCFESSPAFKTCEDVLSLMENQIAGKILSSFEDQDDLKDMLCVPPNSVLKTKSTRKRVQKLKKNVKIKSCKKSFANGHSCPNALDEVSQQFVTACEPGESENLKKISCDIGTQVHYGDFENTNGVQDAETQWNINEIEKDIFKNLTKTQSEDSVNCAADITSWKAELTSLERILPLLSVNKVTQVWNETFEESTTNDGSDRNYFEFKVGPWSKISSDPTQNFNTDRMYRSKKRSKRKNYNECNKKVFFKKYSLKRRRTMQKRTRPYHRKEITLSAAIGPDNVHWTVSAAFDPSIQCKFSVVHEGKGPIKERFAEAKLEHKAFQMNPLLTELPIISLNNNMLFEPSMLRADSSNTEKAEVLPKTTDTKKENDGESSISNSRKDNCISSPFTRNKGKRLRITEPAPFSSTMKCESQEETLKTLSHLLHKNKCKRNARKPSSERETISKHTNYKMQTIVTSRGIKSSPQLDTENGKKNIEGSDCTAENTPTYESKSSTKAFEDHIDSKCNESKDVQETPEDTTRSLRKRKFSNDHLIPTPKRMRSNSSSLQSRVENSCSMGTYMNTRSKSALSQKK